MGDIAISNRQGTETTSIIMCKGGSRNGPPRCSRQEKALSSLLNGSSEHRYNSDTNLVCEYNFQIVPMQVGFYT